VRVTVTNANATVAQNIAERCFSAGSTIDGRNAEPRGLRRDALVTARGLGKIASRDVVDCSIGTLAHVCQSGKLLSACYNFDFPSELEHRLERWNTLSRACVVNALRS